MAGGRHLEKSKIGKRSTDRHEIWHANAHWHSIVDQCVQFKNPRWRTAAILHNRKNDHVIDTTFGILMHIGHPNRASS